MISYSGIFRAAKLVIDQHCEGAATFATGRAGCSRTATPSALAHFLSGRHDKSCSWAERAMRAAPSRVTPVRTLAASCAMAGWMEEAHEAIDRLRQIDPKSGIVDAQYLWPFRRWQDQERLHGTPAQGGPARMTDVYSDIGVSALVSYWHNSDLPTMSAFAPLLGA